MKKRPEILDKPMPRMNPWDWADVIAYVGELEVRVTRSVETMSRLSVALNDVTNALIARQARDVASGELARATDTIVVEGKVALEKPSAAPIPAAVLMDKSDREGDPDLN